MSDVDLRHEALERVWSAIEESAPTLEWTRVAPRQSVGTHRRRPVRALALTGAALALLLVGIETGGVLAVRAALAGGVVVSPEPVELVITTVDAGHPWSRVVDVSETPAGIFTYGSDPAGLPGVWRLDSSGAWIELDVAGDLVIDGTEFAGVEYLAGLNGSQAVIWRRDHAGWTPVLTVGQADGPQASWSALAAADSGLAAFGWSDGSRHLWVSDDGAEWTEVDAAGLDSVGEAASAGDIVLAVGGDESIIPVVDPYPVVWTVTPAGVQTRSVMPDRRSLGFGYVLGGFRMPDGLEHVLPAGNGAIAYTGFLQAWTGFEDGLLEPSEAWASMIMISDDLETWQAHVLPDFAIATMVQLGDGFLAVAALPPADPNDLELETTLFYSDDALTWRPVEGTPAFSKPVLAPINRDSVVVIDEHATEKDGSTTSEVFVVSVS